MCNESESSHHADSLYDNDSRQESFVRCESRPDTEDDAARHGPEDVPSEPVYEQEQHFEPQEHFVQQEQQFEQPEEQQFDQPEEHFEQVAVDPVEEDSNYSESRTFESESTFREEPETADQDKMDIGFEPEESSLQPDDSSLQPEDSSN